MEAREQQCHSVVLVSQCRTATRMPSGDALHRAPRSFNLCLLPHLLPTEDCEQQAHDMLAETARTGYPRQSLPNSLISFRGRCR